MKPIEIEYETVVFMKKTLEDKLRERKSTAKYMVSDKDSSMKLVEEVLDECKDTLAGRRIWRNGKSRTATKVIESCNWLGATGTRRGDRPETRRGDRRIVRSYLISAEISGNAFFGPVPYFQKNF